MGPNEPVRSHGGTGSRSPHSLVRRRCHDPRQFSPGLTRSYRKFRPAGVLMIASSSEPRLRDIIEAIGYIRSDMEDTSLESFAGDRRKRWQVERGLEIISEASRHL